MSGPLFSAGASTNKFFRTNTGVHPLRQHGLSGLADYLHQENLSYLSHVNQSLKISELMLEVDKKLAHVGNEARKMGRSFSLLVAIKNLRQQLVGIELLASPNPGPTERFSREDVPYDLEPFPLPRRRRAEMLTLAQALETFRKCIQDFREYDDEMININGALRELCSDIKYWTRSLDTYGQLYSPIVEEYANHILNELKNRIAKMASNLELFTEIGIPAIRYEQKRGAAVLLALSTGATFFSGVTATMLQISYSVSVNPVTTIVNTFWFCSLVLSIGAAINSLLAMVWKQTFHGFRGSKLPRWLTWWISGSPPAFLFISIICFSAGIVLFVFSSDQSPFTSWFTLAATVVTSSVFSANILWMLREQITAWIFPTPSSSLEEEASSWRGKFYYPQQINSTSSPMFSSSDTEQLGRGRPRMNVLRNPLGREPVATTISPSSVKDITESLPGDHNDSPRMEYSKGEGKTQMIGPTLACYGNLNAFGALRDFKCSPDGKYLATASWEAASSLSTTIIFSGLDKHEFGPHQVFKTAIKSSSGPRQLIWSYDSANLIIRYENVIDVWTLTPKNQEPRQLKRIEKYSSIQSIRWYEQEQAFLCIAKHWVFKLGLDGKEIWKRAFNDILLYDASVASGGRLVLLGHVPSFQPDDLKPSHPSVAEKQIRVYQIEDDKKITSTPHRKLSSPMFRIPLLEDVNHITATNNMDEFLISYRSQKPPQIWSLSESVDSPELKREVSYHSTFKDEFEGVSYVSRDSDNDLVISTGRAGDIHFWNRKNGKPVHRFRVDGNSFLSAWFPGTDGAPGIIKFATCNTSGISVWQFGDRAVEFEPEKSPPASA